MYCPRDLRDREVPYTYIHGGFRGTDATFSFYFPPASMYQGRFFQMNVHQLRTTGDSAAVPIPPPVIDEIDNNTSSDQNAELVFLQENEIGFAFNTGGYLVEASPNDEMALTARDALSGKYDPGVEYRVAAAAAKFSRVMAAQIYHTSKRPYGYLSGEAAARSSRSPEPRRGGGVPRDDAARLSRACLVRLASRKDKWQPSLSDRRLRPADGSDLRQRLLDQAGLPRSRRPVWRPQARAHPVQHDRYRCHTSDTAACLR